MADMDPGAPWALIAQHEVALATVREFGERSMAVRVAAVLDAGDGHSDALVEWEPESGAVLTAGEESFLVPAESLDGVAPLPIRPPVPVLPESLQTDPERGEVMAPMGAIAGLGLAVLALARALGGRSVATADFATADGPPMTIAAREGEPLLLAIGEHQFELPVPPSDPA